MLPRLGLALRLLAREWRAGELRLFALALVIAVGALTAVGFFNDRLDRGLARRSAELLGADLLLTSPSPIATGWLEAARAAGLELGRAVDFTSVIVRGERLQLVGVRAIDDGFPPRGVLHTAAAPYQPGAPTPGPPAPGTAWAEARVLQALGLDPGASVDIGNASFAITRVLTDEPGRLGRFLSFAPRVLIPLADLAATGIVQPGSRVRYRYAFAGPAPALAQYRAWLESRLGPSQRLRAPREGDNAAARTIERIHSYFGLTSLLAVVLAGVAIAMAARRYSARHYDTSAMLRALGATQRDILALYLPQLLALGLGASAAGSLVGYGTQQLIYYIVRDLFPVALPPPGIAPAGFGLAAGLLLLLGFALVPVLRLRAVSPLRVLRRDLAPLPAAAWSVLAAAGAALLVLAWRYTGSILLTLAILAGAAAGAAALALAAAALLRAARALRPYLGPAWGRGIERLQRRWRESAGQMLAFGLALMAMAAIALVRSDLLSAWEAQIPPDAPNHFIFNVLPQDVDGVHAFFRRHAIESQALYPLVRGRLTALNGQPVREAVTKEQGADADNAALRRDLNLTWAAELPPDNRIVRGRWWSAAAAPAVSVEAELAQRLGVDLGDVLSFTIGAQTVTARVASIREVQWESFHPNFFMIFAPGALDGFPTTYMTSFHVPPAQKPLLAQLVRAYPAVTVLELDLVLAQLRSVVRQASAAVELLLLFVLAGGFAVLYAALAASLDERFYEGALARTFGASRWQVRRSHLAEFATLGVLAGLLAAAGTEALAFVSYTRVFGLDYGPKWEVWLLAPLAGAILIGLAGFVGTRRVVQRSPLAILRAS